MVKVKRGKVLKINSGLEEKKYRKVRVKNSKVKMLYRENLHLSPKQVKSDSIRSQSRISRKLILAIQVSTRKAKNKLGIKNPATNITNVKFLALKPKALQIK